MIYADDSQLYIVLDPANRVGQLHRLEECIRAVKAWMAKNKLLLNDAKTEVVHFSSRFKRDLVPVTSITVGESDVTPSLEVRNLGAIMDEHLTLSSHVTKVCQSASLALAKIGRLRKYIDRKTTERLVHAFVTFRLDSNNSLLYSVPDAYIKRLQRIQNSAARLVLAVKGKYVNINRLRRDELHWLPVKDRIIFKVLLLAFKCIHGLAPNYLSDHLNIYKPTRALRSASKFLLCVPRGISTVNYGERAFTAAAPKLWNALPETLRKATSLDTFKSMLKTHLFKHPTV